MDNLQETNLPTGPPSQRRSRRNYNDSQSQRNRSYGNNYGSTTNSNNSTDNGYNRNYQRAVPREENGTTYYYNTYDPQQDQSSGYEGYDYDGSSTNTTSSSEDPGRNFRPSQSSFNLDSQLGQTTYNSRGGQFSGSSSRQYLGSWRNDYHEKSTKSDPETFGATKSSQNMNPTKLEESSVKETTGNNTRVKPKLVLKAPPLERVTTNQRDALIDQLSTNNYECMVCCAKLYRRQTIWSCSNCFNIFHLPCIKKWVTSSAVDGNWRCPGCQNIVNSFPEHYICFCGKTKDPSVNCDVPHSCMLICGKIKSGGTDCSHLCSLQCHPGPCPPCTDQVMRKCECGKKTAFVQCNTKTAVICGSVCEKVLNCGLHYCLINCHAGPCQNCEKKIILDCFCKRNKKEVLCSMESNEKNRPSYCCQQVCDRILNCKNHKCIELCHPDQCNPCSTSKDVVISCPCGQTSIGEACSYKNIPLRKSCLDPIPTCGKTCKKILTCGPPEKNHQCERKCHEEKLCPPCKQSTMINCRCGNLMNDIPCTELLSSGDFFCSKKCTKKRSCGRHKCNTKCCIDTDHICPIVCDKPLKCGNHRCEALCHNGHCHVCPNVSFDELRCECGTAVIYPPVPCGTKPPPCVQPCGRTHSCTHPVMHNCHTDQNCPPCSFLTEKWCHGKHELRKNVLCHVTHVSCGLACQKLLGCTRHVCPRVCHPGPCQRTNDVCTLPCLERRKICGHTCSSPCHDGNCPETKCKQMTDATCMCGRRKESILCWKREIEFDRVVATAVASGINSLFLGGKDVEAVGETNEKEEVTVEKLTATIRKEKSKITVMDCDKECARIERNRKMAQALQLENPDIETRLGTPNYTDFCKKFAQKYPQFVEMVHSKLTDVVMGVKRSKKLNHTYAFDSMNRDKRQLIHEYSDHFGVQSESYDEEPNRNVIVTASKDKSWLPSVSLIDAVFKQTALKTDRKNVHQDLELVEPTKTQIIGPSNRRLISKTSPGMVFLNGGS